ETVSVRPWMVAVIISIDGLNSARTCRQPPQGMAGSLESVTIAIAANSLSPAETAAATAASSAQTVRRKERCSTLHPVNILPDFVRRAAPTKKFEYGA